MSDKPQNENDLPDTQTKNPNPPDQQPLDSGLPIGRSSDGAQAEHPANPSPQTAPQASPRGRSALHGLRRRKLFIAPEDAERFIWFRHHMIGELDPQDHTEQFLADAIIAKRWLVLHADEAEAAAMRNAYNAQMDFARKRMQHNLPGDPKDENDCYDMAIAATCTNDKVHLVLRYRTTHERAMFRLESALRQYRLTRNATAIADQRHDSGLPLVRESFLAPTPAGQRVASETIPSREPLGGSTPRASDVGLPINRSPDNERGTNPANPRTTPAIPPSEISNLKSDSPNPPRKPNIADSLASISRRNPCPTGDLRANQTNCRKSAQTNPQSKTTKQNPAENQRKGGSATHDPDKKPTITSS